LLLPVQATTSFPPGGEGPPSCPFSVGPLFPSTPSALPPFLLYSCNYRPHILLPFPLFRRLSCVCALFFFLPPPPFFAGLQELPFFLSSEGVCFVPPSFSFLFFFLSSPGRQEALFFFPGRRSAFFPHPLDFFFLASVNLIPPLGGLHSLVISFYPFIIGAGFFPLLMNSNDLSYLFFLTRDFSLVATTFLYC